jgi:hypothetical protein
MANPRKKAPMPPSRLANVATWLRTHSLAVVIAMAVLATIRVAATYTVFNHTCDEPSHIACGMEWLERGTYNFEAQHPPLARIFTALGPYLAGCRLPAKNSAPAGVAPTAWFIYNGTDVLYYGKQYMRNLVLARLGMMPFFWLTLALIYYWGRRYMGEFEAVLGVFFFTFLPSALAHAGLATTDIPVTAMIAAAFVAALAWAEKPTPALGTLCGACVGMATLCKFSAFAFLPVAFGAAILWYIVRERPAIKLLFDLSKKRLPTFALAVLVGAMVIWAGYRFDFANGVPAPQLWAGIHDVMLHNSLGHTSYLFGERSEHGWWYYYPVILGIKTPLPMLAMLLLGAFSHKCMRGVWLPLAFSLGILLFSMTGGINIGVRHIMPIYVGLALVAAAAAVRLLELASTAKWAGAALAVTIVWMAATSLASHPDYLPYFNALAGDEPEQIAVDSDLDWGQDLNRVGQRLRELGAPTVAIASFVTARLQAMHGYPPTTQVQPQVPTPGWNAVSITALRVGRLGLSNSHPEIKLWPDEVKPTERVGKGMWLYYFPPQAR